jgi:4-hydroxy-3-polyprenylbenzoate decarboxylase
VFPLSTFGLASPEELPVARVRERLLLPFIRQNLPEVVDINLLAGGAFNQTLFVSLRKTYPGQAEKVMYGLWGMSQLKNIKFMVAVDADCDVQNPLEVAARCSNNLDPRRGLHLLNGPLSVLDHTSPSPRYGTKVGLDATAKLPEECYPREWPSKVEFPAEIRQLVDEKWAGYGID